ncbi:MAG: TIGR03086 family metal-binding protein, partial [Actinomycetota bacterium]
HIAAGMEGGMQETFDRLDTLLTQGDTPADRFQRLAGRFTEVARAVPVDAWERGSPCAGWTARDIVRHMVEWMPGMMRGVGLPLQALPSVDSDPVGAWTSLAAQLQAVLDDPAIASREIEFGPAGTHTVENGIGMIMLGDIVLHTWDLARATGLDDTLDADVVHGMLLGMRPMDQMLRDSGHYRPKVAVAADADEQTQLIAFTGRDPFWRQTASTPSI